MEEKELGEDGKKDKVACPESHDFVCAARAWGERTISTFVYVHRVVVCCEYMSARRQIDAVSRRR